MSSELLEPLQPLYQPLIEGHKPKRLLSEVLLEYSYHRDLRKDNDNNKINISTRRLEAKSMIAQLNDSPSPFDLTQVSAFHTNEYIRDCLFNNNEDLKSSAKPASSVLDCQKWDSIPQYSTSQLSIRKHLGRGSFSDVFDVSAMVPVEGKKVVQY